MSTVLVSGGAGGRIMPGEAAFNGAYKGGAGGYANIAGSSSPDTPGSGEAFGGGGGGYGASGGNGNGFSVNQTGAAGGNALLLNGYIVTWAGTYASDLSGHVFGAIS